MESQGSDFVILVKRVQSGDREAFSRLVPMLRPIVMRAVRRFLGAGRTTVSREDFIQEAWGAAYRAIFSYDTQKYPFLAPPYFYRAVMSRLDSVNNGTYMLAMPRPLKRFLKDVANGNVDWDATDAELQASYPLVEIGDIAEVRRRGPRHFDVALFGGGADEARNLHAHLHGGQSLEDEVISRLEAQALLRDLIPELSDFEQRICMLRFVEERSRTEAARILGCSVSGLAKIEKAILDKRA